MWIMHTSRLPLLLVLALSGCGGAAGEAVRPKDLTGGGAIGGGAGACGGAPKLAKPFVVDLDGDSRTTLETTMKKGVVFVSYDCTNLRVLPNCHLADGTYEYASATRRELVVQMKNQDELSVNLPLSAGKLGGQVQSGRTIDLALVSVGQRSTTVEKVHKADLSGSCEGATHFVQMATLGAFSMATGSTGKAMAVAELFKVGASGSSEASRSATTTDGSLEACKKADPDGTSPPTECRAPISMLLMPVAAEPAVVVAAPVAGKAEAKAPPSAAEEDTCRAGYVRSKGICTRAAEAASHTCKPKEIEDCKAQCDKGSFESCYNYALSQRGPEVGAIYKKACDGGVAESCGMYARVTRDHMNDDAPINEEAIKYARQGCDAGGGDSCVELGDILGGTMKDRTKDPKAAVRAFKRACALGSEMGCGELAEIYKDGKLGVTADPKRALELMDRACAGDWSPSCSSLAQALSRDDAPASQARAFRAARAVCGPLKGISCDEAIDVAVKAGHAKEAFEWSVAICATWTYNCGHLGDLYSTGTGTAKNQAKATEMWTKACEGGKGSRSACEKVGINPKK
jgi:TPR repeat protein